MPITKDELFLLKEVCTKVKYSKLYDKYIIEIYDYIGLNLTTRQMNILSKICEENDIELEKIPKRITKKETVEAFYRYHEAKKELSSSKNQNDKTNEKILSIRNQIADGHLYFIYKLIAELIKDTFNQEERDDLYQDMYEILLNSIEQYNGVNAISFITFLKEKISEYLSEKKELPQLESIEAYLEDVSLNDDDYSSEYTDDTIDGIIFKNLSRDNLRTLLELLPETYRTIISLHCGLDNGIEKTQVEIAKIIGTSNKVINQKVKTGFAILKRYPYRNILLNLYEKEKPQNEEKSTSYDDRFMEMALNNGSSSVTLTIEYLEEQYFKNMPVPVIMEIINELPPIYSELLILYYGIGREPIRDISILSKKIGISKGLIYQNRRKATKMYKAVLANKHSHLKLSDKYHNEHMIYHYLNTKKIKNKKR